MEQTSDDYEVILVDNGSSDGSVDYVKNHFPSVRIIENKRNLGFAEGSNVGIRAASGDYVILLNNDTRVDSDFIEVLATCASNDPCIGSVGCKLVQRDGRPAYGPKATNSGFLVPFFMGTKFLSQRVERLFDMEGYCVANCGAAVLYRKRALDHLGGFDPDFWSDWEDHDIGLRLLVSGYKNFYTTRTVVLHIGGGSFQQIDSRNRDIRTIRNMFLTYVKNYDASNLVTRFMFVFMVLTPVRYLFAVALHGLSRLTRSGSTGQPAHSLQALSLLHAYIQFIREFRNAMRKRMKVQSQRKVSDSTIFSLTRRGWLL
jgi:hypothetical protein